MRHTRRIVRKIRALNAADWRVSVEAIATLVAVQGALGVVRFPALRAWASNTRGGRPPLAVESVKRCARFAGTGGRLLGFRCLTQTLALARMLSRRGVETDIRIGVRTHDGKLLAHAWVEWNGEPLLDPGSPEAPFHVLTAEKAGEWARRTGPAPQPEHVK